MIFNSQREINKSFYRADNFTKLNNIVNNSNAKAGIDIFGREVIYFRKQDGSKIGKLNLESVIRKANSFKNVRSYFLVGYLFGREREDGFRLQNRLKEMSYEITDKVDNSFIITRIVSFLRKIFLRFSIKNFVNIERIYYATEEENKRECLFLNRTEPDKVINVKGKLVDLYKIPPVNEKLDLLKKVSVVAMAALSVFIIAYYFNSSSGLALQKESEKKLEICNVDLNKCNKETKVCRKRVTDLESKNSQLNKENEDLEKSNNEQRVKIGTFCDKIKALKDLPNPPTNKIMKLCWPDSQVAVVSESEVSI